MDMFLAHVDKLPDHCFMTQPMGGDGDNNNNFCGKLSVREAMTKNLRASSLSVAA
jgi:hypothetical protein